MAIRIWLTMSLITSPICAAVSPPMRESSNTQDSLPHESACSTLTLRKPCLDIANSAVGYNVVGIDMENVNAGIG